MPISATFLLLLAGAFAASTLATRLYIGLARYRRFFAVPNARSSHKRETLLGGGIVFAAVFLVAVTLLFFRGHIPLNSFFALAGGGAVMTSVGYMDDMFDISARLRFGVHIALAVFLLVCLGGFPPLKAGAYLLDLGWAGHVLAAAGLVWLVILFNFVDGIDAMAATGSVFASLAAACLMLTWSGPTLGAVIALLLAVCVSGFLPFNWPPASLFMGDSGSTFLGYVFGALVLITMAAGTMSLWTWMILLGVFIADTGVTLVLRMRMIRRWYEVAHRSHAYQNLARVLESHRLVSGGVLLINLVWLLPMAYLSMSVPQLAPLAALIALLPLVAISLKYGPLYSSA